MSKYIMRLDDAAAKMDVIRWSRMEELCDKYEIKPLVGIIPNCKDIEMERYPEDAEFWERAHSWMNKGWTIALHGYEHVYCTKEGGINPVNPRSEFAGLSLDEQKRKIRLGVTALREHNLEPRVFFAPSHTFDENTIRALKEESDIRTISDTVANKPYCKYGITFVPQQSGRVRSLPFDTVTFCYHPNMMQDADFEELEHFFYNHKSEFIGFPLNKVKRKESFYDRLLKKIYFARKK